MKLSLSLRMRWILICCSIFCSCSLLQKESDDSSPPFIELSTESPPAIQEPPKPLPIEKKLEPFAKTEEDKTTETSGPAIRSIPRTIIALWDSKQQKKIILSPVQQALEMPLNFLGVKVEYRDIVEGLPDLSSREDVFGIVIWFPPNYIIENSASFLHWAISQIDAGKKVVFIGSVQEISQQTKSPLITELWKRLGIFEATKWSTFTYDFEVAYQDPALFPFERKLPFIFPPFLNFQLLSKEAKAHLIVRSKQDPNLTIPLIVTNPAGAFIYEDYILYNERVEDKPKTKWLVNPFRLLQIALDIEEFPVPDTTTLCGRRVYYSQIDGDGWNNVTYTIPEQSVDQTFSSQVIYEKVITPHPDLPVTVGPIAADLDLKWQGSEKSQEIAKRIFQLPQVEIGSHTFTHPFDWGFFEDYTPAKEKEFLKFYPTKTFQDSSFSFIKNLLPKPSSYYSIQTEEEQKKRGLASPLLEKGYVIPRAYATEPFSLDLEVFGAINEVNKFAPLDKKVDIYQWSGNGEAFAEAVKLTVEAGVQNINGANNRLDFFFPSYSYLYPLAADFGGLIQVFNSNSNENNYTDLWTRYFYGFSTLPQTLLWTESPLRIKPIDLYYHMYSGERLGSLYALLHNIDFIKTQKIHPMHTSDYAKTVNGFFSSEVIQTDDREWLIANRGSLHNFRVDRAVFRGIDFELSKGVIGQRHFQGSLYISLNPAEEMVKIVLKDLETSYREPIEKLPYLLESRWRILNVSEISTDHISFEAQGFGSGDMAFIVPIEGSYLIEAYSSEGEPLYSKEIETKNNTLQFSLNLMALQPLQIEISKSKEKS